MNFLEGMLIAIITFLITSVLSFLMAALMFSIGTINKEEETYRFGFENGARAVEKLKEIGCCKNYQNEREDIVQWINKVNEVIKGLW